jgi:hypothetical protein
MQLKYIKKIFKVFREVESTNRTRTLFGIFLRFLQNVNRLITIFDFAFLPHLIVDLSLSVDHIPIGKQVRILKKYSKIRSLKLN